MEFSIDFIDVNDGDAILLWCRDPYHHDKVFFIDGGDTGYGQTIVDHYREYIRPHLYTSHTLFFINTHPHSDHINGLLEILDIMGEDFDYGIYNDPVACISQELKEFIYQKYTQNADPDITHLYETFYQVDQLNQICEKYAIQKLDGYSDGPDLVKDAVRIVGPSLEYYVSLVQQFTDVDFLKANDFAHLTLSAVIEEEDQAKPCQVVDEVNDTSPENLSSIVLEIISGSGKKILLTSDAGIPTFEYIEQNGHELKDYTMVQLPHHGSRRNIQSSWIKRMNANLFIASAVGDDHHPRKAVINCIKRNVPGAQILSTHLGGTIQYRTDTSIFPSRPGWGPAETL
jgi:beta-lactamase superfamily II metal-dependent hydrolase